MKLKSCSFTFIVVKLKYLNHSMGMDRFWGHYIHICGIHIICTTTHGSCSLVCISGVCKSVTIPWVVFTPRKDVPLYRQCPLGRDGAAKNAWFQASFVK